MMIPGTVIFAWLQRTSVILQHVKDNFTRLNIETHKQTHNQPYDTFFPTYTPPRTQTMSQNKGEKIKGKLIYKNVFSI